MNKPTTLTTAMNAFREKYFGLPGDLPNAFQFWGTAGVAVGADFTGDCQLYYFIKR